MNFKLSVVCLSLLCLLGALTAQAQQANTVSLMMLVEQDPWTARCEDDAKVPGAQGFGVGYASLKRNFTVGHRYRVSGNMGWSFLLTVDANGIPSVSEIQTGPYLAKAPLIQVDANDLELKNPVEVIFGPVKEFSFEVPVDYLGWEIPGAYAMRIGSRKVELPDGKWTMHGALGWSIPLEVANGQVQLGGEPAGVSGKEVLCSPAGLRLVALPNANRVTLHVPALLGSYSVQMLDGKTLLPAFTGPQTAALPVGKYKLVGSGWNAELAVAPGMADATLPPATFAGVVAWPTGVAACRPGPCNVNTPWGVIAVQVPDKDTGANYLGVGWSKDKSTGLLVAVTPGANSWKVNAKFLRGGGQDWRMSAVLLPMDQSNPLSFDPAKVLSGSTEGIASKLTLGELPAAGAEYPIPAGLPSGAYQLMVTAQPTVVDRANTASYPQAAAVVTVTGAPAASLWFAVNRVSYRADEPIEVCAWQSAGMNGKYRALQLAAANEAGKVVNMGALKGASGFFSIDAGALAPGEYRLELRDGTQVAAQRTVTVLPDETPSHFPIHAYGSVLDRTQDVDKLNAIGVNAFLDQAGVYMENEPRVRGIAGNMSELAQVLPDVGPADRYAAQGDRFMDYLDKLGWKFFAQWGSAHQPYGYGITFGDPTVVERLTMTSLWASQYGRQHPGFLGMNVFDEGGTPRGPHFSDDGGYIEYENFKKKYGHAKPLYQGEDDNAARAWIYDKQDQHNFVYGGIGRRLQDVNALADKASHLYLGTQNGNLNSMAVDGGHPPLAYKAITLSTFHWYPGYIQSAFILLGNEYHFMQPTPIEFWPLIWADGHLFLTRHEVNLAVSRQVDGVGHFEWPGMLTSATFTTRVGADEAKTREEGIKALHARLTRFGDLFRAVRRDRTSEVAVLYSLYSFAPTLLPKKDDTWSAYTNAYRAAYTGYLAITACLRKGMQTGWVSEEEILQKDGLAGRKVLIVPGITAMLPELKAKITAFIAGGGTVFVDGGTTIDIPGAKKLAIDFGAEADKAKYPQKDETGKETKLTIDRVVLDEVLPALSPVEAVVGTHLQPGAIDLLVTKQVSGQAAYYYCLNDRMEALDKLPAPLSEYIVQKYHLPIQTDVTLPDTGVVYDIFAGKEVARANGSVKVPVSLAEGEMAFFAVLPEAIGRVAITAPKTARAGQPVNYQISIFGASGKLLNAAFPLEIQFLDAAGTAVRPTIYRSAKDGVFAGELRIGAFDPAQVRIAVRELMSGMQAQADLPVNGMVRTLAMERKDPVVVENGKALKRFMTTQKNLIIALGDGDGAPDEAMVAPLVNALRAHGVTVEVRRASELARKSFDSYVGRGMYRMQAEVFAGSGAIPEIDHPVIAVGSSENNVLIRIVTQERNWTRYADRGFPGAGRGYLVHMWQPFSLTDDAVLAVAEDAPGMKKAINWLVGEVK